MQCFLEDNEIKIGNTTVLENCLNVLGEISNKIILPEINYENCPTVPLFHLFLLMKLLISDSIYLEIKRLLLMASLRSGS